MGSAFKIQILSEIMISEIMFGQLRAAKGHIKSITLSKHQTNKKPYASLQVSYFRLLLTHPLLVISLYHRTIYKKGRLS